MPVLTRSETQGVTAEQILPFIAQTQEQMKTFPGFIAQMHGPTPGGYQVTEVWETQEAHERWVREVIAPLLARQMGITDAPTATYQPLDGFVTR